MEYTTANLQNIYRKRTGKRMRLSSYDRTGGNDDFICISPGDTVTFAAITGTAVITHFWCTLGNIPTGNTDGSIGHEQFNVRKVVLKAYWDNEINPSVQAPLGDFFGMGHGITKNFVSEPLQMSPEDGHGLNCWFPMPFHQQARFTITNDCQTTLRFYFYLDYELVPSLPEDTLYFHAIWNRECPTTGITPADRSSHKEWTFGGPKDKNTTGDGNYIILDTEGNGHYVGCNINIHNLNPSVLWDWFGEGDDMIFIDGEPWPPTLHGTGTEDYINCAWSPTQEQCAPWHGIILSGDKLYKGKITYYRYHIQDPIIFNNSIKVTIEHGHNNMRSDDWSSTAYWYQTEPHKPHKEILPVEKRLPISESEFWWSGTIEYEKNTDRFLD